MFKSCLSLLLGFAALTFGLWEWHRVDDKRAIVAQFPAQYRDGEFVRLDHCRIGVGGYSYIFQLSPKARRALQADMRTRADQSGVTWGDGFPELMCLEADEETMKSVREHAKLAGSYHHETRGCTGRLFVPSLGLIVGGNIPD